MKYFRNELYEKMQVYEGLVFSDTNEKQKHEIDWYIKQVMKHFGK